MPIAAVLFDADGVVQTTPADWYASWGALIENPADTDHFLKDIFAAELPYLTGGPGLGTAIGQVLKKWGSTRPVEDALGLWTHVTPDPAMLALVDATRRTGATVALATNQQPHRLNYMKETLGYSEQFDHLFVSCEMGVAKPAADFFLQIVERLDQQPGRLLFIDDNADNVSAAREVGLNAVLFHLREGPDQLATLLGKHGIRLG